MHILKQQGEGVNDAVTGDDAEGKIPDLLQLVEYEGRAILHPPRKAAPCGQVERIFKARNEVGLVA
jgi:hypothetical protein